MANARLHESLSALFEFVLYHKPTEELTKLINKFLDEKFYGIEPHSSVLIQLHFYNLICYCQSYQRLPQALVDFPKLVSCSSLRHCKELHHCKH
jgi:hypothetical protein